MTDEPELEAEKRAGHIYQKLMPSSKVAYFDCSSGISGDMCLGALVDAGVPLPLLRKELRKLLAQGYRISRKEVLRGGLKASKVDVALTGSAPKGPKRFKDVKGTIEKSSLSPLVKKKGIAVFKSLFKAESAVHGEPLDKVHLHELGAVDALVDVMGTLICLEALGIRRVYASSVNVGGGSVETSHGVLPVPAPATTHLLKGTPVYASDIDAELTTPTGAAILKAICTSFSTIPAMTLDAIGTGAGSKDLKDRPNILRVMIGTETGVAEKNGIVIMETNIDDMDPRIYEHVMDGLLKAGALDVYLTQVMMKKGRPGVKLTVLCEDDKRTELERIIFAETTTIGLRYIRASRTVLERKIRRVETPYGIMRVKDAKLPDGTVRSVPEYEDCKRAARRSGVPLQEIIKLLKEKL